MPLRDRIPTAACLLLMAVWLGGFTFYGAAVVPVLHDELDGLQAGSITRRVTDRLNFVGAAVLVAWWLAWSRPGDRDRLRAVLLAFSTACLVALAGLHRVMDTRLDAGEMAGFYPLHRVYLWISTAQWVANAGLLVVGPRHFSGRGGEG